MLLNEDIVRNIAKNESSQFIVNKLDDSFQIKLSESFKRSFPDEVSTYNNFLISEIQKIYENVSIYMLKDIVVIKENKDKLNKDENKIVLRKIGAKINLSKEDYERKKTAAQYGSGFDKTIEERILSFEYFFLNKNIDNIFNDYVQLQKKITKIKFKKIMERIQIYMKLKIIYLLQ
jgi:hypothetical protein